MATFMFIGRIEKPGRDVQVVARVERVRRERAKNGNPFYELLLKDLTGSMKGFVWSSSPCFGEAGDLRPGDVIKAAGSVREFSGTLSIYLDRIMTMYQSPRPRREPGLVEGLDVFSGKRIAFDIETLPLHDLDQVPAPIAEKISERGEREGWDVHKVMSLSPIYGKAVSLALLDVDDPECALVIMVPRENKLFQDQVREPIILAPSEKVLLESFWKVASASDLLVSFNGRRFDIPFLIVRSVVNEVSITVELLGSRYDHSKHFDVYEFISSHGLLTGPHSLEACCFGFGIGSPKQGLDGSMVRETYMKGRLEDVGLYNLEDVRATRGLFKKIEKSLDLRP